METITGGSSEPPHPSEEITDDDDGGASKKPFLISTRINKFPSSVHKVLSNEDLLIEILIRLPILSLHLFKCVSKQWRFLITSPSFVFRRTQIPKVDPPSVLFIGRYTGPVEYDFVSFDPRISAKRSILFTFNSKKGTKTIIQQSCNGLLLCYIKKGDKYCVFNPSISMFKRLPPIHDPLNKFTSCVDEMKMAFDPNKSPHYNVVHVGGGYSIRIQTYSSKTGIWSVWDERFPCKSFKGFRDGIYWNGAIHWFNYGNEPFHFKLEYVGGPVLTNIHAPLLTVEGDVLCDRKLIESHGSLLLLCKVYAHSRHLDIYEMKNGYTEWSVKYYVDVDDMMRPFATLRMPSKWGCYSIWSIVLGEREADSFMVIELSGKVLQYKFGLGTAHKLLDFGKGVAPCDYFEFIASFAHV